METFNFWAYYWFYAVVFALIGAGIGSYARNRPLAGFFWGLVLGPLGWLVILVGGDARTKCRFCQSPIDPKAVKCPKCQSDLRPKAKTKPVVPQTAPGENRMDY